MLVNKKSKILLVGAVVYDVVENETFFGGTSANISYGLSLLKEKPILASIAGKDFTVYAKHLKTRKIENRVAIIKNGKTAAFRGATNPHGLFTGNFSGESYHANLDAYPISKLLKKGDWKNIGIGVFSPGIGKSILRDMKEFRKHGNKEALVIFDPGQSLATTFSVKMFTEAIRYADILVLNEPEAAFLKKKLGFTDKKLWAAGLKYFIITKAEKGSELRMQGAVVFIPAKKAKKVIDPIGAGDAYRAGLIHGLLSGKLITEAMNLGSKLGALCVAKKGGQTYKI